MFLSPKMAETCDKDTNQSYEVTMSCSGRVALPLMTLVVIVGIMLA
jgi:hypothetical protein